MRDSELIQFMILVTAVIAATGAMIAADARVKYSLTGNVKCRFEQVE